MSFRRAAYDLRRGMVGIITAYPRGSIVARRCLAEILTVKPAKQLDLPPEVACAAAQAIYESLPKSEPS
jgi:hypothetical protein